MTTILGNCPNLGSRRIVEHLWKDKSITSSCFSHFDLVCKEGFSSRCKKFMCFHNQDSRKLCPTFATKRDGAMDPYDFEDEEDNGMLLENCTSPSVNDGILRDTLERIIGNDDSLFCGADLANLIRNKYGRSYDVQLIKKEFMGKKLLALNVMWKYMEQRSFPLTEEEYLLRLDDVANTLRCWGAVSHVRNSLERLKERPRVGKAVSIFIDMDESGGRANEWIYK